MMSYSPSDFMDEVVFCDTERSIIVTRLFVGGDSPFFEHHFFDYPVVPGTFLVECLAQAASYLYQQTVRTSAEKKTKVLLGNIEEVRFHIPVLPVSTLSFHVQSVRSSWGMRCQGSVYLLSTSKHELVASGRFTLVFGKM